jgi:hypothetical protein
MAKIKLDTDIAYAAATDAANRRMAAAGRKKWNRADYNAAVREFNRLMKNPYVHERLISPRALARRGKTKYRSVRTPRGSVLRIAFPEGRRTKGSGELQAVLHKNPASEVAQEIYRQLGGGRFAAFTGARRFVGGPDFLQFQIPLMRGVNKVRITLAGDDTYTLEFFRITAT